MKRLYTNDIQGLYRVISSIANLTHTGMELSSYVGQMSALKNEFSSIMPKSTNVETSQSKINRVLMILTLLSLG